MLLPGTSWELKRQVWGVPSEVLPCCCSGNLLDSAAHTCPASWNQKLHGSDSLSAWMECSKGKFEGIFEGSGSLLLLLAYLFPSPSTLWTNLYYMSITDTQQFFCNPPSQLGWTLALSSIFPWRTTLPSSLDQVCHKENGR